MDEGITEKLIEWINIFTCANSPNPEIQKQAEYTIKEQMNNNTPFLLLICTSILLIKTDDDQNFTIPKCFASILLTQMLNFRTQSDLEIIRHILTPELIEQIKNALKQNIFSDVPAIRNKCAQCYSILFSILSTEWPDGIDDVVNSFADEKFLPYGFIGFISIMREIINQQNFPEIFQNFSNKFSITTDFCIFFLSKEKEESNYIPELRIEACRYLSDIVSVYPSILNDGEKIGAKIPILLENLKNSFYIENIELFNEIHNLLFLIVWKFYIQSPCFMQTIANYVLYGFSLNSTFSNISITFWNKVATFEGNLLEKVQLSRMSGNTEIRMPFQPLLTETAIDSILPILANFVELIDVNDISAYNIEREEEPSMYATMAIASFYKVDPAKVFTFIQAKINEEFSKVNWPNIHSGIQFIYSISDEPLDLNVGAFISQFFEILIQSARQDQVPRLRELSLFVLYSVLQNYSQIVTEPGDETDKRISELIDLMHQTLAKSTNLNFDNYQMFIRFTKIITRLAESMQSNETVGNYFDQFYEINVILFNFGISIGDQILIQDSNDSINKLISNAPIHVMVKFDDLYLKNLEMLENSKEKHYSQEIQFCVLSFFLSNIKEILNVLNRYPPIGKEIISKYALKTLEIIFELMKDEAMFIYEEGLNVISSLIISTNAGIEIFTPASLDRLINFYIFRALNTQNERDINAACRVICYLFSFLSNKIPELNNYIISLFNLLNELFRNNIQRIDILQSILGAIANIVNSINNINEAILSLELPLRQLFIDIFQHSFDFEDDTESANYFYTYLADALAGYEKVYNNKEIENIQILLVVSLAQNILKFYPEIDDDLYLAFGNAADQFVMHSSGNDLNNPYVMKILELGFVNVTQEELKAKFNNTIEIIKNR